MGSTTIFVLVAVFLVVSSIEAAGWGRCPAPSMVYGCSPVCRDDYDCSKGKVCCANSCNTKSCSEPARGAAGNDDRGGQKGGPGVYCGNVKCSPFEKCVKDPRTGKLICRRA